MADITDLARGRINGSDELAGQLIRPEDMSAAELHCCGLPLHPITNPLRGTDHRKQSQLERAQELSHHGIQHRVLRDTANPGVWITLWTAAALRRQNQHAGQNDQNDSEPNQHPGGPH